ncbi:MAG: hypothetical protein H6700_10585 [Myxococcales bacterium]|nr:hypothetical protein [Myxococcales bacterium]
MVRRESPLLTEGRARLCTAALALSFVAACGGSEPPPDYIERSRQQIQAALHSDEPWVRAETVRLLGLTNGVERAALRAALDDDSVIVRTAAIEALLRSNDPAVEEAALAQLIAGTEAQRIQLLELIAQTARPEFREQTLRRALVDLSPSVQLSALRLTVRHGVSLGIEDVSRLLSHSDARVADAAFEALVALDAQEAMEVMLRGLRDSSAPARLRAMRQARLLPTANVWPMMRSIAARSSDPTERRLALVALGNLGDPTAEQPLRDYVLGLQGAEAAEALAAISHIPTARAANQPLVHRRDPRREVRDVALSELIRQRRPADDFVVFLTDADPAIAERALLHMQTTEPDRAAAIFAANLEESDDPVAALGALYRVSLQKDIRRFLDAAQSQLRAYLHSDDPAIVGLAARLVLVGASPAAVALELSPADIDGRYALLEAGIARRADLSSLYAESLGDDLTMIRVAAALGIMSLGDQFHAPAGAGAAGE